MRIKIWLSSILLISGCYQPEDQYTKLKEPSLKLERSNDILADSFSIHTVTVTVPGLRYRDSVAITLITSWGQWQNHTKSITMNSTYNDSLDSYQVTSYLMTGRTVSPFTIEVTSSPGIYSAYNFNPKPHFPDTVQILADSIALKNSPGSFTKVTAYFYSKQGYPSYGFRFGFEANNGAVVVPLHQDFSRGQTLAAKVIVTNDTKEGDLLISGRLTNSDTQPVVLPIRLIVKEKYNN